MIQDGPSDSQGLRQCQLDTSYNEREAVKNLCLDP